ncbi:GyrI-like domain-containing protein [Sphaerisporangium aureirubrum]|uniref:GyrI-like domain-containing protein n=1 Tax=Sphaerisporangium aureirubrum TaxID=1544736 RepID=A0ABW1NFJ7_9ACTN
MNVNPVLEDRAARPYAAIPISAPMSRWGEVNALVPEMFAWLAGRGILPAGPPFYRYWVAGDWEREFRLEVGVPVAAPVEGDGRVVPGTIPAGRYLVAVHQGHPDRLIHTIHAVDKWAADHGVRWDTRLADGEEVWQGRFDFWLTDPAHSPDPETWSTELAYLTRST